MNIENWSHVSYWSSTHLHGDIYLTFICKLHSRWDIYSVWVILASWTKWRIDINLNKCRVLTSPTPRTQAARPSHVLQSQVQEVWVCIELALCAMLFRYSKSYYKMVSPPEIGMLVWQTVSSSLLIKLPVAHQWRFVDKIKAPISSWAAVFQPQFLISINSFLKFESQERIDVTQFSPVRWRPGERRGGRPRLPTERRGTSGTWRPGPTSSSPSSPTCPPPCPTRWGDSDGICRARKQHICPTVWGGKTCAEV